MSNAALTSRVASPVQPACPRAVGAYQAPSAAPLAPPAAADVFPAAVQPPPNEGQAELLETYRSVGL